MPTSEPSTANLTGADPKAPMRVALPNKGALSEEAAELMSEAGYRLGRSGKALRVYDRDESVEFLFLRPRDIAIYVGSGVIGLAELPDTLLARGPSERRKKKEKTENRK